MVHEANSECTHTIEIRMENDTWAMFRQMIEADQVFDSVADAVEWYIRHEMAAALAKKRSQYAGFEVEPDELTWPVMSGGRPASWADALASAEADGRRLRGERARDFRRCIAGRIPVAMVTA